MEEFLHPYDTDNNIVTPEALAWKLLMDDDVEDYAGILLPSVDGEHFYNDTSLLYDTLSDQFQILITMYMEMLFGMLKINHVSKYVDVNDNIDDNIDFDATFKPDVNDLIDNNTKSLDGLIDLFREKFKKVRVFLSVRGIYDANEKKPKDYGSSSEYYCRIILKNSDEGKKYFMDNKDWLDPDKYYTFVMRDDKKRKHNKLADFYAVCTLSNMKIRISFTPINIIIKTQE